MNIYLDRHQLLDPLELISRALTDSAFSKFLLKIPTIFSHYNAKSIKATSELYSNVTERIRHLYWLHYCEFRQLFGLKLNYSLKYEKGINVVQLIKRRDRREFKMD